MLLFSVTAAGSVSQFGATQLKLDANGLWWAGQPGAYLFVDARTGRFHVEGRPFPVLSVNGSSASEGVLRVGDQLTFAGHFVHVVTDVEAPTRFDGRLIEDIQVDEHARAVYLDELEAEGKLQCLEYARLVSGPSTEATQARLAELAPRVWSPFRVAVARGPIRRCNGGGLPVGPGSVTPTCPGAWERLSVGTLPRTCDECRRYVTFASSYAEIPPDGPYFLEPTIAFNPHWNQSFVRRGRPLLVDGVSHTAPLEVPGPQVDGLVSRLRCDAEAEHAAVGTFARTLCELMALGAPLDLLDRTQRALADEVRHTRLTLAQLERLGDAPRGFGQLPQAVAPLQRPLEEVVADVEHGAQCEQVATDEARVDAQRTTDPALRAFFTTIADDEARHAQLARDTVEWLRGRLP